jgi:hypothetical protein
MVTRPMSPGSTFNSSATWRAVERSLTSIDRFPCLVASNCPNSSTSISNSGFLKRIENLIQLAIGDIKGHLVRGEWFLAHVFRDSVVCLGDPCAAIEL